MLAPQDQTPPPPASVAKAIKDAEALTKAGKFAEAIGVLDARQKELGEKTTNDEKRALLVVIADVHRTLGEDANKRSAFAEALQHYTKVVTIERDYRPRSAARLLNDVASIYSAQGDKQNTLDSYQKAAQLNHDNNDPEGEAFTLDNIGMFFMQQFNFRVALHYFERALPLRQIAKHKSGEAWTLNNIGRVYNSLGEKAKALEFYNQALPILRQVGDKEGEADTFNNIGRVYNSLGEKAKALEFYNLALPMRRQVGDKRGEAATLSNIGAVYWSLGEKAKALEFYNQALPMRRQVGDKRGEAYTINGIGTVYSDLGEKAMALEFFNLALPLYRQVKDKYGEVATLNNIGFVFSSLGEKAKALEFYNLALPIQQKIGDKEGETKTLHNVGWVYSDLDEKIVAVMWLKGATTLLQRLREATPANDRQSQQTFLKENEIAYLRLVGTLNELGRTGEAQQGYLLAKQQEVKAKGSLLTPDLTPLETNLLNRYNQKADKINQISSPLVLLQQLTVPTSEQQTQIKRLEAQLAQASQEFVAFLAAARDEAKKAPPQKVDKPKFTVELHQALNTLQAQTGKENATVFTLVRDDAIEFMVVKDGKTTLHRSPIKREALHAHIERFRIALLTPPTQSKSGYDPRPDGKALYDLLVKPIAATLAGCTEVFWLLDGKLRYIPLAALSPDGKTYLVQQPVRHTLLSPESISTLATKPKPAPRLLACGTTLPHTTEGFAFTKLPGVQEEVMALRPSQKLLDGTFTQKALMAELGKGYSRVHLATHFALRPGDLYNSFLLLGDGKALRLSEINELPDTLFAGVDLLTLSACDTGSGAASSNGAELEGLSLVAQRKGAASVVSSLWPVSDASTASLMATFYAGLGTLGKGEALRQAQAGVLTGKVRVSGGGRGLVPGQVGAKAEAFVPFAWSASAPCAHPYYWAAFTLTGNTR